MPTHRITIGSKFLQHKAQRTLYTVKTKLKFSLTFLIIVFIPKYLRIKKNYVWIGSEQFLPFS
jgi:hypothetical protein